MTELNEETTVEAPKETKRRPNKLTLNTLEERVDQLERALAKVAHYSGQHKIMVDYGIEPWVPGKDDMRKYKD